MLESLSLGLVGMTLVFLGLGIVAASIYVLEWAFRERGGKDESPPAAEEPKADGEAVIAAIALALARLQSSPRGGAGLGKNLEQWEVDAWMLSSRSRQLRTWEGRR
jgi:Na+-transporting methylmalonyl-CoA/oxaloacetate decarboxylase gamma subunit